MKPPVTGILESALYVEDLDRSVEFYERVFGFEPMIRDRRLCAMNVAGSQVFLLFKKGASKDSFQISGGAIPGHDGEGKLHVAFSIDRSQLDGWRLWLKEQDVEVESTVDWARGGTSLYFRDPDDHVIELATPGTWELY
jgi:catechol 2,3-dioxygenase-like lactoylglutathione lyase family enzyme